MLQLHQIFLMEKIKKMDKTEASHSFINVTEK